MTAKRLHVAVRRRPAWLGSSWRWYAPDACSYGSINLGRFVIDFGRK